jgi:L-ascorbate metabolism protein UlaG (beta-lactamase superfamily)
MQPSGTLVARIAAAVLLFGGVTLVVAAQGAAETQGAAHPKLTYLGQSCFVLESPGGARVVMDPIPAGLGYSLPSDLGAQAITISHEHADHNNVALVKGEPKVLRGLTEEKTGWTRVRAKVKDVTIRSVGTYHDAQEGKERGLNAVFIFEVGGQRIAHLGDLGHELSGKQLREIGRVDVVLVPVGGVYTLDSAGATKVIAQLRPRTIVVPMHYKTDVLTIKELAKVDAFLAGKSAVRRESGNTLDLGEASQWVTRGKDAIAPQIVVLDYK